MRLISADTIFPISVNPIKNGVIIINDSGEILSIDKIENHQSSDIEYYEGIIVPGFINTHCHLELSHMKGLVPTGTGLLEFIDSVVKYRNFDEDIIRLAIEQADHEMYEKGIQAVGDICNKLDTAEIKQRSKIAYYSFVEMFDFMQEDLFSKTVDQYLPVYKGQSSHGNNQKSLVPHAPYTVSKNLFDYINSNNSADSTISIHNQETLDENQLFLSKEGGLLGFYASFGMNLDQFEPMGKSAIHYALNHMDPDQRTLFVHNTVSDKSDIQAAHEWSNKVYWATCANANLYIENRLPDYKIFIEENAKMTIGTDSLTSNWQLSIWEEIKTIHKYQSYIPLTTLLKWACLNGAKALNMHESLGSLEPGKKPGLVHINLDYNTEVQNLENTQAKRIV